MRDELKYPRAFALMPVPIEMAYNEAEFNVSGVYCYVVSPCYIVRRYTDYMKYDYGIEHAGFEVVFPRKYLGLHIHKNEEEILERNLGEVPEAPFSIPHSDMRRNYQNAVSLDYNMVTEDYEEAIKIRDKENEKLVLNSFLPSKYFEDDSYKDIIAEKIAIYNEEVNKYQEELNKLEPKEQVKRKIKTPASK